MEIVGARAIPVSAIRGNAAPIDGTATRGAQESAKTSPTQGSRSPGELRQLRAPYQSPPTMLAIACTAIRVPASSGAPWSVVKAVIDNSPAPTASPTPKEAPINTHMLGDRSGPTRRCSSAAPRHWREAREEAKTAEPSNVIPMHTPRAAVGDAKAITAAAINGP